MIRRFGRHPPDAELSTVVIRRRRWRFFRHARRGSIMNSETSESISSMDQMGGTTGLNGNAAVRRVAQKAHEAVDRLEQTLGSSSEKVMGWQQEYGEMAREQVRSNPLAVVAGAFAAGFIFAKLMR
jgi:ElaB/YqjD/DUF883 family membrane-anchored ribosome-binding protein